MSKLFMIGIVCGVISCVVYQKLEFFIAFAWKYKIIKYFAFIEYGEYKNLIPRNLGSLDYINKAMNFAQNNTTKDDILIVTFPKTGTHFLLQSVIQLTNERGIEEYKKSFHEKFLFLDMVHLNGKKCDEENILGLANFRIKNPLDRGIIATHYPASIINKDSTSKYIIMMRNPSDALISLFNMFKKVFGPFGPPDVESIYHTMFKPRTSSGDIHGYMEYYLQLWEKSEKYPEKVLFLFYEDIQKEESKKQLLLNIAKFLDRKPNKATLEQVMHRTSIDYMKPLNHIFDIPKCIELPFFAKTARNHAMIGKGVSGRGKAKLTKEITSDIQMWYLEVFKDTTFPIERYLK